MIGELMKYGKAENAFENCQRWKLEIKVKNEFDKSNVSKKQQTILSPVEATYWLKLTCLCTVFIFQMKETFSAIEHDKKNAKQSEFYII